MLDEKYDINELGKFILDYKDGLYSGIVKSKIIGPINLMFPSEGKDISRYQIDIYQNIEKDWEKIKFEVTQNLEKGIQFEKGRIDAVLIPHENSHNYNYDVELVYLLKKNFFSRRHVCFSALLKKWELDEIIYL